MASARLLYEMLEATAASDSGFVVNDRDHALQTATRAERAGAGDELVVAALFHDAAKAVDHRRHGSLIAGLLAGHVGPDVEYVLRVHQDFAAAHLDNGRARHLRLLHRADRHYALVERFVDEWDAPSRDPGYDTEPIEHFGPVVARVRAQRYPPRYPWPRRLRGYSVGRIRAASGLLRRPGSSSTGARTAAE